jgi:hypothetical protein
VSRQVDLAHLAPRPDVSSSRYCLAAPGAEYLAYVPAPAIEVSLEMEPGRYRTTWIDPVTGSLDAGPVRDVARTGQERFQCPDGEGAALHLVGAG